MTPGERGFAVVASGAMIMAAVWAGMYWNTFADQIEPHPVQTGGSAFTPGEVRDFLAAARKEETIQDPLQRCLAYPDPPGSDWSHVAVVAYCENQLTTGMTFDEVKTLIEASNAQAVDRRMAELLQQELSGMSTPGLFDMTYEMDFGCACSGSDPRPILDAWKRQSPRSAFAYAASGMAYVQAAREARGSTWAAKTPQSNFDAMQRLSTEAAADLERAVALDNRIMPAYAGMITLAGLKGDDEYAQAAARRALKVERSNYLIYSRLTWFAQPNGAVPLRPCKT